MYMSKILNLETGVNFVLGFLIGKTVGTIVSVSPFISLVFEDGSLLDILVSEFVTSMLSFNMYHYALGLISGLIIVIWRSTELFE